jgi:tetratricopeptide (TPR) repeat protein
MNKSNIIFLPVPDALKDEIKTMSHHHEDEEAESFLIDSSIPLPVELEEGDTADLAEKLSWEMILSGMIRVVSAGSEAAAEMKPEWIDYYRRFVLAVKPEIYNDFTGAAVIKAKNGDFDMALEIMAALEGLFPLAPGVALNKALILEDKAESLEKNGYSEEAEKFYPLAGDAYQKVLSMEPLLPDALFNAGFFYMNRRDYGAARECFSEYIPLAEDSEKKERALVLTAEIKNRGLDDDSFIAALDFIQEGEEEKGLEKIREFLERHPKVWNGWFVLGWALRKQGRWEDALESFKKAFELGSGDKGASNILDISNIVDIRNEMAICLMEMGELSAARKELEAALRAEPENIKIISNLGVLAEKAGESDQAAAFFRIVLELSPDDPVAKAYLDNFS